MIGADIDWEGQSGKEYGHWIHRIGTDLTKEPGNYIYAKKVESGGWTPIYIGQSANLQNRDGDREACAKLNGATHVHAHTSPFGEAARTAEQADLVAKWNPPCNA
ncbi:MAG: hypothetical protein A3G76_06080 [Acidobacteria bacterium RIFCSPLOWO2_12_FULL_65_11]|nr:MAG: hypothetical protein A3H95_06070 [Acidobacteria bacterium RIFCSPLOWO2_02_FULL_64_15]OFW32463.1 MAG: hypothetical protein A3G76_06080 [Acidobacteria bacterium RIFCSPLOWO2_12_FULL_65_11]